MIGPADREYGGFVLVATALLTVIAGPAEAPPVQRPTAEVPAVETGTDDGESPPTEASAEASAAPLAPAPRVEPTPAPEPTPASEPSVVTAEAPFGSASAPASRVGEPTAPLGGGPATGAWRRDYVEVTPPRHRGTGLLVGSGLGYAAAVITQLIDATVYRNVGSGLLDRLFLLTGIALAPAGADLRARHDAYYDAAIGLPTRPTRPLIGAGLGLTLLGGLTTITSEVMWWQCAIGDEGPYHTGGMSEFEEFSNRRRRPCNYGAGRTVVDLGAGTLGAGLGMLAWGLRYRHDARIYSRARFAVLPRAGRGQLGLTLAGSF